MKRGFSWMLRLGWFGLLSELPGSRLIQVAHEGITSSPWWWKVWGKVQD